MTCTETLCLTAITRRWKFYVELENGNVFYINEAEFTGTNNEADREAQKRADEWENKNDGLIVKITCESMGKI